MLKESFDLLKDWLTTDSHLLLNQRLDQTELQTQRQLCQKYANEFPAHVWLNSSGSSQKANESLKLIALSKKAILNSAEAVNRHLQVSKSDRWACALPVFHVGGLGIYARAFVGGNSVLQIEDWEPLRFVEKLVENQISLTSLVPTQVFDLVQKKLQCPKSLRAVVVGGSAIDPALYREARELGWPLLISYGMTETASQVATATIDSLASMAIPTAVQILSHAQVNISEAGHIEIQCSSMMTGYAQRIDRQDYWRKVDSQKFLTQDRGEVQNGQLKVFGRESDFIKILGEGVSLSGLEARLTQFFGAQATAVITVPDCRRGFYLHAFFEGLAGPIELSDWNKQSAPFERLESAQLLEKLPRTPLGKINKAVLHA